MENFNIQIIDGIETIYEEDLKHLESYETIEHFTSDEESDNVEYDLTTIYEINNNESTVTYFTKELTAKIVNHTLTPIEYPATSLEGVAYIFNIEDWKEPLAAFKDIQYSIGKPCGEYKVICPYLNVKVKRKMRTCQGSKLCVFSADEIQNETHQNVDINSDFMTKIAQEISSSNLNNNTFEFYLAAQETSCKFQQNSKLYERKPVLCHLTHQDS
ncbi:17810_t:CDS:2, partial [Cetraspora pellucida]